MVAAGVITGSCKVEVNPFGPFQLYETPAPAAVNEISPPRQAGELLPATGAAGVGLTVIEIVSVASGGHPATEATSE